MIQPTVCILTAGKGTRLGMMTQKLNKALLPLQSKALLTHIIEKFPHDGHFVVAVGYLANQVQSYLSIAHPDRNITLVSVDNYEGAGSGPGYSLLCCRKYLERPFYFVSCDTLWEDSVDLSDTENWVGVSEINIAESERYCNVKIANGLVVDIRDKVYTTEPGHKAFVGLCFIKDFTIFWPALENREMVAGEHQISNGLRALITQVPVRAQEIKWTDVGDADGYRKALLRYENYDFSKPDEALYIVNGKVIKFFADSAITLRRVQRARLNPKVFPRISDHVEQLYAYEFVPGKTLYQINSPLIFSMLLEWLESHLWKDVAVQPDVLSATCHKFYWEKTLERVRAFQKQYSDPEAILSINGRVVSPLSDLFERLPWQRLRQGVARFIHGDLQFDNILFDPKTMSFTLLDWRQDFAGNLEFGDLYYDLAKLYAGIIVNYDYIKRNLISYQEEGHEVFFDFAQRYQSSCYLELLSDYLLKHQYDLSKVKLLAGLIYLNMSSLHHYPFDKVLYYLGRVMLHNELQLLNEPNEQ